MDGNEFRAWWDQRFQGIAPVGWAIRKALPQRWLRIHSLPESKRYPENEEEYAILLDRHNQAATEVLGAGNDCILLFSSFGVEPGPAQFSEPLPSPHLDLVQRLQEVPGNENPFDDPDSPDDPEPLFLRQSMVGTIWQSGAFDTLLREAAEDHLLHQLFISLATEELYAPYDGGADLIFATTEKRDAYREKWSSWLSTHPEGL
ncbi:MAG: hypothetical protein HQL52_16575 [Magnetococcales bacterium]|nr:hypothetical protein [Magnetococcales bacterium]